MRTEKEKLIEFTFLLMKELGGSKYMAGSSQEVWLKYPLSGVRQAANDMIEASQGIYGESLARIDIELKKLGCPTLSNMRKKGYKKLLQILSRSKIKNEDEWRLLRSFVESEFLNNEESQQTQALLDEFEFKST